MLFRSGVIFFSRGLDIKLNKICSLYCKTNHSYQFGYFQTYNNQFFNLITIYKCNNESIGYNTLCLENGNQKLSNINITYNYNKEISGISYISPNNMNSNFLTFYNNKVKNYNCIMLNGNNGIILKSNIINNDSPYKNGVLYVMNSLNYSFYECIFDKNHHTLIFIESGLIFLINCSINHDISRITTDLGNQPYILPFLYTVTNYYSHDIYYCSQINNFISIKPVFTKEISNQELNILNLSWISIGYIFGFIIILIIIIIYINFRKNKEDTTDFHSFV